MDTDNGSEFLNHTLLRCCEQHQISFTRCRAYTKNDQCYVEQKNWSVVRKTVGYERYEGPDACQRMLALYEALRFYVNFFQPSMKLLSKERNLGPLKKRYDKALTPYRRALQIAGLSTAQRRQWEALQRKLDPVDLLARIVAARDHLLTSAK